MAATTDDLKRALGILEGPLRFARKGGHALASLSGFEGTVTAAVTRARLLNPGAEQKAALDRLLRFAAGFDALDLSARTLAIGAISREIATIFDTSSALEPASVSPSTLEKTAADVTADVFSRPLSVLKGVGPAIAAKLATRGLHTLGDALLFLPRRYEDRRQETRIGALQPETHALVRARIATFNERVAYKKMYELTVVDDTGELVAKWFGFRPSQFRTFVPGANVVLSGDVRTGLYGRKEMIHPDLEFADAATDVASFGRIIPVYAEIGGLSARAYRRLALRVVSGCSHEIVEFHSHEFLRRLNLVPLAAAISAVHFPPSDADFTTLATFASPAQRRLVFDELFFVQLGLALRRRGVQLEKGLALRINNEIRARVLSRIPFDLTGAQSRAFAEVVTDLAKASPMNRLLQGDVGSGKTAVALASALVAVENGYQTAVMAPTELLAEQHFRNFERLLGASVSSRQDLPPIRLALVAAGLKSKVLERARREVESGTARIVVGTHALLSQSTHFKDLALVVVDEQHRFGVLQRATLTQKGLRPHVLVMTATPIPRTLAMTLYGDLDVSVIDELPPGRTPVTTRLFTSRTRERAYLLAQSELAAGRQVYVVLPLIEESEKLDLRAATVEHERLQAGEFRGLRVGLVHGRLASEERDAEMDLFRRGDTQVLVATTVIEVGVDVPNASVMIVEHAERFGLSQLHQLRGRVGRGSAKSYCLLIHDEEAASQGGRQRLNVMAKTNDGFRLAEEDLSIRGPGDFLGTRQSGLPDLIVADLLRDQAILKEARAAAFHLTTLDPDLLTLENRAVRLELERRWAGKLSLARVG